jgi:3-methyladenine DNA glycosylase Mpg
MTEHRLNGDGARLTHLLRTYIGDTPPILDMDSPIEIIRPPEDSKLVRDLFIQRPEDMARNLLGRTIVRESDIGIPILGIIREVAAWRGAEDSSDDTINNGYGIIGVSKKFGHYLIDIGTGAEGKPSCVTLIAVDSSEGIIYGPGNVSKYLQIDPTFDSIPIDGDRLWIGGKPIAKSQIRQRNLTTKPANWAGNFYFRG